MRSTRREQRSEDEYFSAQNVQDAATRTLPAARNRSNIHAYGIQPLFNHQDGEQEGML